MKVGHHLNPKNLVKTKLSTTVILSQLMKLKYKQMNTGFQSANH